MYGRSMIAPVQPMVSVASTAHLDQVPIQQEKPPKRRVAESVVSFGVKRNERDRPRIGGQFGGTVPSSNTRSSYNTMHKTLNPPLGPELGWGVTVPSNPTVSKLAHSERIRHGYPLLNSLQNDISRSVYVPSKRNTATYSTTWTDQKDVYRGIGGQNITDTYPGGSFEQEQHTPFSCKTNTAVDLVHQKSSDEKLDGDELNGSSSIDLEQLRKDYSALETALTTLSTLTGRHPHTSNSNHTNNQNREEKGENIEIGTSLRRTVMYSPHAMSHNNQVLNTHDSEQNILLSKDQSLSVDDLGTVNRKDSLSTPDDDFLDSGVYALAVLPQHSFTASQIRSSKYNSNTMMNSPLLHESVEPMEITNMMSPMVDGSGSPFKNSRLCIDFPNSPSPQTTSLTAPPLPPKPASALRLLAQVYREQLPFSKSLERSFRKEKDT